MPPLPDLVRLELPTPDVVLVRCPNGDLVMFADNRLSERTVADAICALDEILAGTAYPLGRTA